MTRETKNSGMARSALSTLSWDTEKGRPHIEPTSPPKFSFGQHVGGRAVRQPRGHSVGIVGFGAIGKEIGNRLASIGMDVHYTKTSPLSDKETSRLGYPVIFHENLQTMLPKSDLLVLACPLNPQTHYLMNDRTLALLPDGAKIINIGRGALIDTRALISSLKTGRLAGAALDVFEQEPIIDEELCERWDVILTPHIGSSTMETVLGAEAICANNILNVLCGDGKTITRVN